MQWLHPVHAPPTHEKPKGHSKQSGSPLASDTLPNVPGAQSTAQLSQLLEALRLAALDDEVEIATLVVVSPRPRFPHLPHPPFPTPLPPQ